jgi:hypothetical protein
MEILLALGVGIGLSSVAGVRAFIPLALAVFFTQLGLFESPAPVVAIDAWTLVGGLAALAVLEIVLDKFLALERVFNYAMVPVRAAAGALLFTAALGLDIEAGSAPWLAAGAVVALVVAALEITLRPSAKKTGSAGVSHTSLSAFEDLVAVLGAVLGFFVPYLPLLLVAFLLFFFYRVRKRRGRKYGGLRILGD